MRDRIDHDEVVQRIYDLADSPGRWQDIIGSIARGLAADKGHIFLTQGPQLLMSEVHGYEDVPRVTAAYYEHFVSSDPRISLSQARPGRVLRDADGAYDWTETPVYNELLEAQDIRHSMYIQIEAEPTIIAAQAFMRSHAGVEFDREDALALQRLQPHLCRAIRLGRTLDVLRAELADLRLALCLLPISVLILDSRGAVLCSSARADELLASQKSLVLEKQRLTAALPRHAKELEAAVKKTVQYAEPHDLASSRLAELPGAVEVEVSEGRSIKLSFMPLRPRHALRQRAESKARVLVALHASDDAVKLSPELIGQLHGLTPTESLLAAALAEGRTVLQYAHERGCSELTARVHLKHILEKTGTHRQADLVRVLLSSAAVHLVNQ